MSTAHHLQTSVIYSVFVRNHTPEGTFAALEHDLTRISSLVHDMQDLINHTALLYFAKGATLLYAGQEVASRHRPSLFDRDTIVWDTGHDLSDLMRTLAAIQHDRLEPRDVLAVQADDNNDVAVLYRDRPRGYGPQNRKVGIFSLRSRTVPVAVEVPDGFYTNLIDEKPVEVLEGVIHTAGKPIIFTC